MRGVLDEADEVDDGLRFGTDIIELTPDELPVFDNDIIEVQLLEIVINVIEQLLDDDELDDRDEIGVHLNDEAQIDDLDCNWILIELQHIIELDDDELDELDDDELIDAMVLDGVPDEVLVDADINELLKFAIV